MGPPRRDRSGDAGASGGVMGPPQRDRSADAGTSGGADDDGGVAFGQSGIREIILYVLYICHFGQCPGWLLVADFLDFIVL